VKSSIQKILFLLVLALCPLLHGGEIEKIENEYIELANKISPAVVSLYYDLNKIEGKKNQVDNSEGDSGNKGKAKKVKEDKKIEKKDETEVENRRRSYSSYMYQKSGVIVSDQGHILTSINALFKEESMILNARLFGGKSYKVEIVKKYPKQKLALLKIDIKTPKYFAVEKRLPKSGSFVMAATDEMFAISLSKRCAIQTGVVCQVSSVDGITYIETDTGSGSSSFGGALSNAKGDLIGVIDSFCSNDRWFCTAIALNNLPKELTEKFGKKEVEKTLPSGLATLTSCFQNAADKIKDSVVTVVAERKYWTRKKFIGDRHKQRPESGRASGLVIDSEGLVLTSYNNIETAESLDVVLADEKKYKAEIVGFDAYQDVALLKIKAEGLKAISLSKDVEIKTGYFTVVVGRDQPDKEVTIATGIVASDSRKSGKSFETDAPINFANSGGAVIDIKGQLMGMAAYVNEDPSALQGVNSGVGFCLSVNSIIKILPKLKKGEKKSFPLQAYLGISFDGDVINQIYKGSSAEKYGLKVKDKPVAINGKKVSNNKEFTSKIKKTKVEQKVKITVLRDGEEKEVEVVMGSKAKRGR